MKQVYFEFAFFGMLKWDKFAKNKFHSNVELKFEWDIRLILKK